MSSNTDDTTDATTQITLPADMDESDLVFDLGGVKGRDGQSLGVSAQATGNSTVIPTVSEDHVLNDDFGFDLQELFYNGSFIDDPTIRNLHENSVDYTPAIGEWLLDYDDMVPSILSMFEGFVMGTEGLMVDPADPDDESDQDFAEDMRKNYSQVSRDNYVDPSKVVRQIFMDNARYAVSVLRSEDLESVEVATLDVLTDQAEGNTVYIQEETSYETIEVQDNGDFDRVQKSIDEQALRRGEEVFDAKLYRTPPLRAIADDIINKLQMKRFKARKAEIASIGGIFIKVNPPAWLPEDMYFKPVPADENPYGDTSSTRLEIATQRDINEALQTLQQYQTATIMSIPEHWEVGTIDVPEMDETFDEMVDGYNQAISRRMLLPFDLLDLTEKGAMLSAAVASWQREIQQVFDQYATQVADEEGISGNVTHRFPSLETEDEKLLVRALAYSGLLGLSQSEARKIVNSLEGIDLDTDVDEPEAPPLGDMSPQQKTEQSRELLRQQQQDDGAQSSPEGTEDNTPPEALDPEMPQNDGVEAAMKFDAGDVVETDTGIIGVVLDRVTHDFTWPGGQGETKVEASSSRPVYIVGIETGGSKIFYASELSPSSIPEEEQKDLGEAEIEAELKAANIPGVDDPEVGFQPGEPEGWTTLSYLSAYASVGGSWRSCVSEMSGDVRSPKRWCSALKDEVYGTELWRGGWD